MTVLSFFTRNNPCLPLQPRLLPLCLLLAGIASGALAAPAPGPNAAGLDISDMPLLRNEAGSAAKAKPRKVQAAPVPYAPIKNGAPDNAPMPEIEMYVGESRVFPAPGVARIAVGNGKVMTASALDEREVILFGNAPGNSTLSIWNADGRHQRVKVTVVSADTSRVAREISAFLARIPGARSSIVADKVIVEGDDLSDADREKVAELAKRYPEVVNFTSQIGWEPMIMMDVKVVEFPKTELRELGLKWSPTGGAAIGSIWYPGGRGDTGNRQININTSTPQPITAIGGDGPVSLPSSLTIMSALNLGLNAQLNMLDQKGRAAILAEPQLSTRSGYKASFLAGGEFPYSVANDNGVTIQFKQYGIKLDIEPKVGRNGVIRAIIESEVSSLDGSVTSVGGPALLTRRTKTEFNVRAGETIVLSGLLQRTSSTDIDKVPLLGDIPILGALFRSKRFQNKETELVVFVTPTSVDSRSPGLVDRVERATERLSQTMGPTPYLSNPLQPGQDATRFNGDQPPAGLAPAKAAPAAAPASSTPPAPVRGSPLRVKRNGAVLRAEASASALPLADMNYNTVVRLGSAEVRTDGGTSWRNVIASGVSGWILVDDVEPIHVAADARATN
ncbi:MAG TPA: pilus assembly protein N-terminal domain-containing protein [Telluria sp.]|jgi:pilus assembly protein CpaC